MRSLIWSVLIAAVLASCQPPAEHAFVRELPAEGWPAKMRVGGDFEVTDTLNPHHFFITLRNTNDYPYSNLFLFVHTHFPNGRKSRDTIECVLADRTGRWLGSGNGFIVDQKVISNKIMYNYQKRFPLAGTYRIELEHAMRKDTLRELLDVGIRIEKAR